MDDEDLFPLLIMLAGAYFVYRYVQQSRFATASSSPNFAPYAPGTSIPGSPVDRSLSLLMPQTVSPAGQAFIKQQEGFDVTARPDGARYVIGWGHDIEPSDAALLSAGVDQASVMNGAAINQTQAQQIFDYDIQDVESTLAVAVTVPLTQSQYDALADFVFNEGPRHFKTSTLLRLLNQGDYAGAAAEFKRWDFAGGKVSSDLQRRRALEQGMFTGRAAA